MSIIQTMERVTWFFLVYLIYFKAASCLTMVAQTNHNVTTDQSALLALKARITSDPLNMIFTNWSTTTPVCNWLGVTCGARHHRVAELNLSYFGLVGDIPPELGNLSFLGYLNFRNNSFHGTLPQQLARLRRLKYINLGYNKFTGFIPSWFGSMSKLQRFGIHGNQFSGSILATMFNLSALQILDLSNNQLSGKIPREIGNLTVLQEINLDDNNFEEIPNEMGTLSQLQDLFVQDNALKGHVPSTVFNMSSLVILTFYGNKLEGRIPDNICEHLPNVQILNLGSNQFNGPLPSKLWQCKQLLTLYLGGNKLGGRIPRDIGNLTQIKSIDLGFNNLTGAIPHEIGHLPNLEKLNLNENNLIGVIPASIVNISTLIELYLGFNHLSGAIPQEIGHLPKLERLALGGNNFNGHIPSSIFNMSTLTLLDLSLNQLSGSLPANIGFAIPNLEMVQLGGNHLTGVIPKSISNASELKILDMCDNNFFSGFIPSSLCLLTKLEWLGIYENNLTIDTTTPEENFFSCLANLRSLRTLDFSVNPLNAKLPISFSNLSTSLENINLGGCNLRGNIPNDVGNLSSLIFLAIEENKLSGPILNSVGRLHNLQGLYMYDNALQGYIPEGLCHLQRLDRLYLGENQLSGPLPSCLGNLTALRELLLWSNLLNTTIPSTLWGLIDILKIDLSSNSLIGPLSGAIGNLKVATYINVSYNQLSGSIPSSVGSLLGLINLSFAHNNLEGHIPSSFATCLSLERLDLSHNNLIGVIPKSLEALSYLKYLNFSFNKLQGEIPIGGPFRNLSAESFVSNHGLCGASRFQVPPCKRRTSMYILKYVIPGILSAVLLATFINWMLMFHRRKNLSPNSILTPQDLWRRVSYLELVSATDGFSDSNLLGTGGFGSVYKGILLDGIEVAVKVFNLDLEGAATSFEVECEMLSNVRHRNLVKVISCCSQIDFKGLVLSYMPNGSLEKWLYSQSSSLNIVQRLDIMIDVASALEYLHHGYEVPIVHCDLKPSNILLDDDMVAHVSDFGIAKLLGGGDSMTQTMTLATIGYMAPEYGMEGTVTKRGDVYSFGIILMETFTRRKPTDDMFVGEMRLNLWVENSLNANAIFEVVDATLLGTEEDHDFVSKGECLSSIMRLAVTCSAESPEHRINMQEAVAMLKRIKIKFLKDAAAAAVVLNHRRAL